MSKLHADLVKNSAQHHQQVASALNDRLNAFLRAEEEAAKSVAQQGAAQLEEHRKGMTSIAEMLKRVEGIIESVPRGSFASSPDSM
jgi:vacuolar-type H+-ATPase catalytic subunit A/Vma1